MSSLNPYSTVSQPTDTYVHLSMYVYVRTQVCSYIGKWVFFMQLMVVLTNGSIIYFTRNCKRYYIIDKYHTVFTCIEAWALFPITEFNLVFKQVQCLIMQLQAFIYQMVETRVEWQVLVATNVYKCEYRLSCMNSTH